MPDDHKQRVKDATAMVTAIKVADKYGFTTTGILMAEIAEHIAGHQADPAPES